MVGSYCDNLPHIVNNMYRMCLHAQNNEDDSEL